MASLLDLSLVSFFGSAFTFILIWVIVYALLEKTKALGADKKGLNGIIALAVAVLVLASKFALKFVNFIVPWFLIMALVIFLIIFVFKVFGIGDSSIMAAGTESRMWIITISVIILLFGFGAVFGQSALQQQGDTNTTQEDATVNEENPDTNTGNFNKNLYNTLFHPKVLGLIFLLIIGILALVFLTSK
ncbi:hypothetical protein C4573_04280 [Candidatus Woesearchaeota archaeon]|nr:MAG: hypothetical protein C4573_04280 [Candidatus Woesearchaeota archaeon]